MVDSHRQEVNAECLHPVVHLGFYILMSECFPSVCFFSDLQKCKLLDMMSDWTAKHSSLHRRHRRGNFVTQKAFCCSVPGLPGKKVKTGIL